MVIRYRDDARRLLNLSVVLGNGTTFSIYDVMGEEEWAVTIVAGDGALVLGGALTGALEALRRQGTTAADVLSCPTISPGGLVTVDDMKVAAGWLSTGLLHDEYDPQREQVMVTEALEIRRWQKDLAHVTSLLHAIAITAGHAGDIYRG